MSHGGKREGSGRKKQERTVRIRVPASMESLVLEFIESEKAKAASKPKSKSPKKPPLKTVPKSKSPKKPPLKTVPSSKMPKRASKRNMKTVPESKSPSPLKRVPIIKPISSGAILQSEFDRGEMIAYKNRAKSDGGSG